MRREYKQIQKKMYAETKKNPCQTNLTGPKRCLAFNFRLALKANLGSSFYSI